MAEDGDECGDKSIMDAIDDYILTEILLRLPMKMKFRYKAVCKRWLHLISTPFFKESVLVRNSMPETWYLLYENTLYDLTYPDDTYPDDDDDTYPDDDMRFRVAFEHINTDESIVQTCIFNYSSWSSRHLRVYAVHNGLILCSKDDKLYVCNPVTGETVLLPDSQTPTWEVLLGLMVSSNNGSSKFKVVRVTTSENNDNNLSNFTVFSSDVGEWRDTGVAFPELHDIYGHWDDEAFNSVVHDGKIIWRLGTLGTDSLLAYDLDKNEYRILSFNLSLLGIPFPKGRIGTSCGRLYYANCARNRGADMLSVWVLENYETEEWRPLLMTPMSSVLDLNAINHHDSCFSMSPLAFHPFDMDLVYFRLEISSERRIVSFNLRTKIITNFTGQEVPKGCDTKWPISLFMVPLWPTSVPQPIW